MWNTLCGKPEKTGILSALLIQSDGVVTQLGGVLLTLYHGRIRRLVPRECLRLQGYYDWQIDKIIDSTSDAQLYKQAGNGVTVNVIEAIGRLLQKADSELNTQKVSEKGIH